MTNPANRWQPQWEDALRELKAAGKSRAQISVELTVRFARPFSCSAVKNKIKSLRRECLCLPRKHVTPSKRSPVSHRSPSRPIEYRDAPMLPEIAPELLQAARVAMPDPFEPDDPMLPGKRFVDLQSGECKWELIGGRTANFRFCARHTVPGKPYCWDHSMVAYLPYTRNTK